METPGNRLFAGAVIRGERLRRDWSQEGLCRGICTVSYLSKIEQGKAEGSPDVIRLLLERLEVLNRERGTTILMVTHDAFTASCCRRVVFLRDGQIFQELSRGELDRRAFFAQIIRVITQLGGEMEDVL